MTIAILLSGPSLARLTDMPAADLVIGVKRAGIRWPCDWSVVLDSPDLRADWFGEIDAEYLLTRSEYRPKYTTRPGVNCEDLESTILPHAATRWGCFSSSAALVLAKHLGASRVDVWGADFGQGDTLAEFDGFESPEKRYDAQRWAFELECWNRTAEALSLEVNRHGLDG